MKKKIMSLAAALLIVAIAAAGGWYYYRSTQTEPAVNKVFVAERGKVISKVSATGTIKPVNSVEISSKITARIKEVAVKENQMVKKGQVLVILEDKELETKLERAGYQLDDTLTRYERLKYLYAEGAASKQDYDSALLAYRTAKTELDGVKSNLDDTVVVSPMDGMVVGEPKPVGAMVTQGVNNPTVIMLLADLSQKQIDVKVDETDIGKIELGQQATFRVDAYPDKVFNAAVAKISYTDLENTWSPSSSSSATVIYYSVTLNVDDPENLLRPAMTARADIHTAEKDDVVLIPLAALKTTSKGKYVIRQNPDGTTERVTVNAGLYSNDKIEITEGIEAGDKLIVSYGKKKMSGSGKKATALPRI